MDVEALLRAGAGPDARGSNRSTGLILASEKERVDAVNAMLAGGAALECIDYYNCTPLMSSERSGCKGIVEVLTALVTAAWKRQGEVVDALLWAGAHVDAASSNRSAALMFATRQ